MYSYNLSLADGHFLQKRLYVFTESSRQHVVCVVGFGVLWRGQFVDGLIFCDAFGTSGCLVKITSPTNKLKGSFDERDAFLF